MPLSTIASCSGSDSRETVSAILSDESRAACPVARSRSQRETPRRSQRMPSILRSQREPRGELTPRCPTGLRSPDRSECAADRSQASRWPARYRARDPGRPACTPIHLAVQARCQMRQPASHMSATPHEADPRPPSRHRPQHRSKKARSQDARANESVDPPARRNRSPRRNVEHRTPSRSSKRHRHGKVADCEHRRGASNPRHRPRWLAARNHHR